MTGNDQNTRLLAVYRDGDTVVLLDAGETYHVCRTPEDLWRAVHGVIADKALPAAEVKRVRLEDQIDDQFEAISGQVTHELEVRFGPVGGKVLGTLGKDLLRSGARIARNMSRKGRS